MTGAAAAAAALGAWSLWFEPRRLVVRREQLVLPAWPAALDGLRVGLLSDLHAGMPHAGLDAVGAGGRRAERRAARPRLPARRLHRPPGAVRAAGRRRGARGAAGARCGRRAASSPCSATTTGTPGRGGSPPALAGVGIPVLEDQAAPAGDGLWAAGVGDYRIRGARVDRALADVPDDEAVLLLSHDPDVFPIVPARVALTLSGPHARRPGRHPLPAAAVRPVALRRALRPGPRRRGRAPSLRHLGPRHERDPGAAAAAARGRHPDAARAQPQQRRHVLVGEADGRVGRDQQRRRPAARRPSARRRRRGRRRSTPPGGRGRRGPRSPRASSAGRRPGSSGERQVRPAARQAQQARAGAPPRGPPSPCTRRTRRPRARRRQPLPRRGPRSGAGSRPRPRSGPREVRFDRSRKGR